MIEILSPAGDEQSFYAAVANGADAIYLGLTQFNARAKAQNFTVENLKSFTSYAHLFGVKVFVTINTLIKDSELSELLLLVKGAIAAKVDAFIVQDFGIVYLLNKHFPGIVLHASTQMGIHNVEGAKLAKEMGISRIVLSRETPISEIKKIKAETNLEIEYFVHGALCVAFSGNCYFSSFLHGESGNRGRCLQLCRLPYRATLNNNVVKDGFLISPYDISLLKQIKELVEAGVNSFKIEGRMKRAGYVALVTNAFKTALQSLESGKYGIEQKNKDIEMLKVAFSRGRLNEEGYLYQHQNIINTTNNNHTGTQIGYVTRVKPFKDIYEITLKVNRELHEGDGLKFYDNNKEFASVGVGNVVALSDGFSKIYTKTKLKPELAVHLILDKNLEDAYVNKKITLNVNLHLIAKINAPAKLIASCNGIQVCVESEELLEKAKTSETSELEITQQLSKLNDTNFKVENITVEKDNVFIVKSVLNQLRRKAVELLELKIIEHYESRLASIKTVDTIVSEKTSVKNLLPVYVINNIETVKLLMKNNFEKNAIFAYAPKSLNANEVNEFYESLNKLVPNCQKGLLLPTISFSNDIIIINEIIKNIDKNTVLIANNLWGLMYSKLGFTVIGGPLMNVLNNYSALMLEKLGANAVVNSIEQNEISFVKNEYVYSFGRFPLMTYAHCPYQVSMCNTCKNCVDHSNLIYENEKGSAFEIRKTKVDNCYFELLGDKVICYNKHNSPKYYDFRNVEKDIIIKSLKENKLLSDTTFGLYKKELK